MNKLLLLFTLFPTCVSAITVDEMIESFEMANVYAADWYTKGDSHIAESHNKYRDIKINLTNKGGAIIVTLPTAADYDILAIMPCYKLTKFINYDAAKTWNDPDTQDETVIKSVFNKELKIGEEKHAELRGWKLKMKRFSNKFSCEVLEQQ